MNQGIKAAAHQLAELQATENLAAENLAAAHHAADNLRDRRNSVASERDAIAAARRAGGDADGARLALLNVDVEGLDSLLVAAGSAVAAAQAKADETRIAVDGARQQLEMVKQTDLLAKLKPHADALVLALAGTMTEIKSAETVLRLSRPSWAPPRAFANDIRKLDLVADGIPGLRQ